jgi:LacI family transcriptional regulator
MSSSIKRRIALIGMPIIPDKEESLLSGFLRYAKERKSWEYVFSAEGTVDSIKFLLKSNCDGALVRLITPAMAKLARRSSIPMVNVSTWLSNPGVPTVCRDDGMIGRFAAEHLLQRGFRRFGCVVCPGGKYVKARAVGFHAAIEAAGFACDVFEMKAHISQISRPQEITELDLKSLKSWLTQLHQPIGLFWTEDHVADQLIKSCRQLGIRVPQDVAVISAPNRTIYCEACDPTISSVNSFEEAIGYEAAHWLDRMMAGEKMEKSPQMVSPSHVVIRKSSDTFAADDPDVARALQFIYENLSKGINASDVINHFSLPRRTFYRAFQATTGQTPKSFIQDHRIRVALDLLLKKPKFSLQSIAESCGFGERERLKIAIKKATGKTPQAWISDQSIPKGSVPPTPFLSSDHLLGTKEEEKASKIPLPGV